MLIAVLVRQIFGASLLLSLVLLVAGCSPELARAQVQRYFQARATTPVTNRAPDAPDGRVLLQGVDGNLYLVNRDGSERFALTNDAEPTRIYAQPTWSPDGNQIAWSKLEAGRNSLVVSRFDGKRLQEVQVPFLPFYIFWSPLGDRLAYLSNWVTGERTTIALRLVQVSDGGGSVETLAQGSPYYFSWSPDGERLLVHVDNERVELKTLDGDTTPVAQLTGFFPAPQWSPGGETIVFATLDDKGQHLIVTDLDGNQLTELTDYTDRIAFSQSPDGGRLAYVVTQTSMPLTTAGPLYVVDVGSRTTRELSDRPVVAFFWSPDSQKLAYLSLERVGDEIGMRWYVWNGRGSTPYAAFVPSQTMLTNYLPFFDQYAQSHQFWSPDSTALVFAGRLASGERGIWVQELSDSKEPVRVGSGVYATWAPQ